MKKLLVRHKGLKHSLLLAFAILLSATQPGSAFAQQHEISFTISLENPDNHYYHITLDYKNPGQSVTFRLASWTPGYYLIMDYAKNLINFKATDQGGKDLAWSKTSKNSWKIETGNAASVKVSYDIYSYRVSVADPFLDGGRAFMAPAGLFMYPEGKLNTAGRVTISPDKRFPVISTGLDAVPGIKNTFSFPDYDVLFDSPILAGTQDTISFNVRDIKHIIAMEHPGSFDRNKIIADHKKIVETAADLIGEIPYRHYTFIVMDRGMGGLEHQNSMAVYFNTSSFGQPQGYDRWLDFVTHEFFHLYNVKRIRPVELGPFDYDKENFTSMLWMSEGFTVYYEYIILNRAGLMSRENVLRELGGVIKSYENIPGHLYQSAAGSSMDTWIQFFNRSENAANTTISYYDKGCAIGMLLDLKIRHETRGKKSLDDVMRTLYQVYYKDKKRGFTNSEFTEVCEKIAGCSLAEILDKYVNTTENVDYNKFLGYAGLRLDMDPVEDQGSYIGTSAREDEQGLVVSRSEFGSPGYKAGLGSQDVITTINGEKASQEKWNQLTRNGKPGDKVILEVRHRYATETVNLVMEKKVIKAFEIKPLQGITQEQKTEQEAWLRN